MSIYASSPPQPGRAAEVVRRVEKTWLDCLKGKQEGYEVALYIACPFGTHRVMTLFSQGEHILLLNIQTGGEYPDMLYCPVEQASFLIQHFRPSIEKEKVLVGFGVSSEGKK